MLRPIVRSTWLPLGIVPIAVPAVLIAVLAAAPGVARLSWPHLVWHSTAQLMHEHLLLSAPVAAAGATYVATRISARGRITSQPYARRAGSSVLLRTLLVLCAAFVGAFVVGMAPLLVRTSLLAENSTPAILPMVTGLVGMIVAVVVGYTVGIVVSSTWVWPLVLVGAFVVLAMPAEMPRLAAVVPVTSWELGLQWREATAFQLYRLTVLILIGLLAARIAVRALKRVNRWRRPSALTALLTVGTAAFIVLPFQVDLTRIEWAGPVDGVCEQDGQVTYCVHPARASQLGAMRSGTERVLAWTGVPDDDSVLVVDAALASADDDPSGGVVWIYLGSDVAPEQSSTEDTAYFMSGFPSCEGPTSERATIQSKSLAHELNVALVSVSTAENTDDHRVERGPFAGLNAREFSEWYDANAGRIRECALSDSDLR
ncbi:hypothetical protein [Phytoactinopolyspora limicola]|uniref:hypothetical protein n=1 Tax=Phytoactinopolyspora limicola TaxID=2715536 RepID=UPI0014099F70|nr:hypothetical protein [Phytoactinopolyspora limicola]